jgi:hypothetical protein
MICVARKMVVLVGNGGTANRNVANPMVDIRLQYI